MSETFFGDIEAVSALVSNAAARLSNTAFASADALLPLGIVGMPGCFRGVVGTGMHHALMQAGIAQGANLRFGNSVSAIEMALLHNPQQGITLYQKLIDSGFLKKPSRATQWAWAGAHWMTVHAANTVTWAVGFGEAMKKPHLMDTTLLLKCLEPFKDDIFQMIHKSPDTFIVVVTDANAGLPIHKNLRQTKTPDECLKWVVASTLVSFISNERIIIDGAELCDGSLSSFLPVDAMESCEAALVMSNLHPDVFKQPDEIRRMMGRMNKIGLSKLAGTYLAATEKAHHDMESIRQHGYLVTSRGKKIPAAMLCPPSDFSISAAEQDPDRLNRAFALGHEIGLNAAMQLHCLHITRLAGKQPPLFAPRPEQVRAPVAAADLRAAIA